MNKVVFFAFKGNPMCFVHVLLNALDMHEKGMEVKVVLEGEAVTLIKAMREDGNKLFEKVVDAGLVDCVCKACSAKMGVLEYNEASGIEAGGDMMGHPSMTAYVADGYSVITL